MDDRRRAAPGTDAREPQIAVAEDGGVDSGTDAGPPAVGNAGLRAAALVVVLAAGTVAALTVDLPSVATARSWLQGTGALGPVALSLGLAVALMAPVPRTALSVLAGLVAGFTTGLSVAFTGAMLAGAGAFGLSRWLGRPAVARLSGSRLAQVDRLASDRPFVSVLTGRLLPVVPFTLLSYAAGLTGMRLAPYLAATAVGLVPSTVVQVGVGASAPAILAAAGPVTVASAAAALAVLVVLVVGVRRHRRAPAAGPPPD